MTNENVEPTTEAEPTFGDAPPAEPVLLSNKAYDQLKFLAQVGLPALATFYASFGAIWGFPKTDQVVGTIVAFDLLLGLLLGVSTRVYTRSGAKYAGAVFLKDVTAQDGETPLKEVGVSFKPSIDGKSLEGTKEVTFKVVE